jgi:hypothetical protein
MTRINHIHILWLLTVAASGVLGCADSLPQPVPVEGTVTLDGKPLESGTIRFVPELGRPASSKILEDGSFDLAGESVDRTTTDGVPPGKYKVQVSSSNIVDDQTIHWNAPQHYADFRTSGLEVVIAEPTSDLVIELKSDSVDRVTPTASDEDASKSAEDEEAAKS